MNEQKKLNLSFIGKFFEAISFVGKPFSVSHLVLVSGVKAIASVHSTWYVRKIIEENVEGIISLSVCLSVCLRRLPSVFRNAEDTEGEKVIISPFLRWEETKIIFWRRSSFFAVYFLQFR